MVAAIARFELRQQLRSHVFWVVAAISLLMVFGSVSVDELRVGLSDGGMRNGARAVVETHLVWSLFFMFTTAAFVADAMLRDELTGFAPLIRATPTRRRDLVLGRFAGAFAAVLLCYLSVPLGLLVAGSGPWHDPATVGPIAWAAYPFALLAMAMPNLLLSAAVSFGLVTATRSMGGALLGAVALLVVYGLGSVPGGWHDRRDPRTFRLRSLCARGAGVGGRRSRHTGAPRWSERYSPTGCCGSELAGLCSRSRNRNFDYRGVPPRRRWTCSCRRPPGNPAFGYRPAPGRACFGAK